MSEVRAVRVGQSGGAIPAPVGQSGGQAHPVTVTARPQIAGVGEAPTGVALVLVKSDDGILRPRPADPQVSRWGDDVRFDAGPPTDEAPDGVFHIDYMTGQLYESEEI